LIKQVWLFSVSEPSSGPLHSSQEFNLVQLPNLNFRYFNYIIHQIKIVLTQIRFQSN